MVIKSKLRIVFLIPRLGIVDRGVEAYVYELAKRLKTNFDITIYVRRQNSSSPVITELKQKGIEVVEFACFPEKTNWVKFLYEYDRLNKLLAKIRLSPRELEMLSFSLACLPKLLTANYDLIFPNNGVWGALVCRLVRLIRHRPFVYAAHGGIEPLIAMQKPDIYFALEQRTYTWLRKHFPKLNIIRMSNGVDTSKFKPEGSRVSINLPKPIVLTVGALESSKRIDVIIKAVAKVKKASLLVLGDGVLKKELYQLAEKFLGKNRFLIRQVPHQDIAKYYRSVNLFTYAVAEGAESLSILEAVASGLTLVVNNNARFQELFCDNAYYGDVSNLDAYAKILAQALIKPKNKKAVVRYMEKFSWDKVAEKYQQTLLEIINRKKLQE